MSKIDPKIVRESQLVMLDSLVSFDKICKKYDLKYWLDSGTLLGAVRHKGFIPWDDDIDISMPVEDYLQFEKIAQDELEEGLFLQTKKTDPSFPFDYMKIRSDKATIIEFHEEGERVDYHQGVFVDIFPMLTLKNTPLHLGFYRFCFKMIRFFSAKTFNFPFMRAFFVKALLALHRGWEAKDSKVIYGGEMPDVAAAFDIDQLFPLQQLAFEDEKYSCPASVTHYLEQLYSFDFMELPPEDKRAIHAAEMRIEQ